MTEPAATDSKAAWRRWARAQHHHEVTASVAAGILDHARRFLEALEPTTVALFSSMPGEISVDDLADISVHRFAITRTPPAGWLSVHAWDAPRERHRYGFTQPVAGAPQIPLSDVGCVLVPALAFDRDGFRLGRGAGYYDELFARMGEQPIRIGVVAGSLVVERLPRDPHDIPMHLLITEDGTIATSSG